MKLFYLYEWFKHIFIRLGKDRMSLQCCEYYQIDKISKTLV